MLLRNIVDIIDGKATKADQYLYLEDLVLGLGVLPTALARNKIVPKDLLRLTDISSLKTLRLINGDVGAGYNAGMGVTILKLQGTELYACTGLQRLVVDVLGSDIADLILHLRSISSSLIELEVGRDEEDGDEQDSEEEQTGFHGNWCGAFWKKLHFSSAPMATQEFLRRAKELSFDALEDLSLYTGTGDVVGRQFDTNELWVSTHLRPEEKAVLTRS